MEIKLDYQRMADTVYAMAALKTFETGEERTIGKHEGPALQRMFERALLEVSTRLFPHVKALDTSAGTLTLDISEPLAHQMLETAVLHTVLSQLHLTDNDPELYIRILRGMIQLLPRLTQS